METRRKQVDAAEEYIKNCRKHLEAEQTSVHQTRHAAHAALSRGPRCFQRRANTATGSASSLRYKPIAQMERTATRAHSARASDTASSGANNRRQNTTELSGNDSKRFRHSARTSTRRNASNDAAYASSAFNTKGGTHSERTQRRPRTRRSGGAHPNRRQQNTRPKWASTEHITHPNFSTGGRRSRGQSDTSAPDIPARVTRKQPFRALTIDYREWSQRRRTRQHTSERLNEHMASTTHTAERRARQQRGRI